MIDHLSYNHAQCPIAGTYGPDHNWFDIDFKCKVADAERQASGELLLNLHSGEETGNETDDDLADPDVEGLESDVEIAYSNISRPLAASVNKLVYKNKRLPALDP